MKRFVATACVSMFCLILIERAALGWGSYAHWLVGNPVGLGIRANLPDYWGDSWKAEYWPPHGEIVPLFPWSHGCMRTSYHYETPPFPLPAVPVGVPNQPTSYGAASAIAEKDMYTLIRKMSCPHQQAENASQMIDTARGFLVHNSFDKFGHFAVFPAGTAVNWAQHSLLEEYVEFRLIDQPPGTLQAQGRIPVMIGFQGHAGIILLSQKCFRKNRHSIDAAPAWSGFLEPGPVETLNQTNARLSQQVPGLSPKYYDYRDYQNLLLKLLPFGWTESALNTWWATVQPSLSGWAATATGALTDMPQVGPAGCVP